MKTKIFSILFCLIVFSGNLYSQIENEINSFVDSTEILVNNGKKLLLKKIQEKDYFKVAEIYNFLSAKTIDKNCAVFDYSEELYLFSFMSDWESWLNKAADLKNYNTFNCYPNSMNVKSFLYEELRSNLDLFQEKLNVLDLNKEDKALLDLYFYIIKNGERDDLYDSKVKSFLKSFPSSRYKYFVNNYLPKPLSRVSMTFSIGAAGIFPKQQLAEYFNSGAAINMAWDFTFNKVYTSLYLNGGQLSLKTDLNVSNYPHHFLKNDRFAYLDGGFNGGYYLLRSSKIHIAPYIAFGGSFIESNLYPDSSNDNDELSVYDSFFVGPGLHTELKLFDYKSKYGYGYYSPDMQYYISLKFDGGYNYLTNKKSLIKGDITYLRASIVWGMGNY